MNRSDLLFVIAASVSLSGLALLSGQQDPLLAWVSVLPLLFACFFLSPQARVGLGGAAVLLGILALAPRFLSGDQTALATLPFLFTAAIFIAAGSSTTGEKEGLKIQGYIFGIIVLVQSVTAWKQYLVDFPAVVSSLPAYTQMRDLLRVGRPTGFFVTANILAAWILLVLPAIVERGIAGAINRVFAFSVALAGVSALVLTRSGGATFGLAVACIMGAVIWKASVSGRLRRSLVWIFVGTPVLILVTVIIWRMFSSGWNHGVFEGRFALWSVGLEAWALDPWPGLGSTWYIETIRELFQARGQQLGADPHNLFLSCLVVYGPAGIISLTLFLGLVLMWVERASQAWKWGDGRHGVALGLVAVFVQSMMSLIYLRPEIVLTACFFLGSLVRRRSDFALQQYDFLPLPARSSLLAWLALLAAALSALLQMGGLDWFWPAVAALGLAAASLILGRNPTWQGGNSVDRFCWLALMLMFVTSLASVRPFFSFSIALSLVLVFMLWNQVRASRHERIERILSRMEIGASLGVLVVVLGMSLFHLLAPSAPGLFELPWLKAWAAAVRAGAALLVLPLALIALSRSVRGHGGLWQGLCALLLLLFVMMPMNRELWPAMVVGCSWLVFRMALAKSKNTGRMAAVWTVVLAVVWLAVGPKGAMVNGDRIALSLAAARPATGWGTGTFQTATAMVETDNSFSPGPFKQSWRENISGPSLVGKLCAEGGWLMLILVILLAHAFWRQCLSSFEKTPPWKLGAEAAATAMAGAALFSGDISAPLVGLGILGWSGMALPINSYQSVVGNSVSGLRSFVLALVFVMIATTLMSVQFIGSISSKTVSMSRLADGAAALAPGFAKPWMVSAQLHEALAVKKGSFMEARRAMQSYLRAGQVEPANSMAHAQYSRFLFKLSNKLDDLSLIALGKLEPEWESVLAANPGMAHAVIYEILSVGSMSKAVANKPNDPFLRIELAGLLLKTGEVASAVSQLNQALELEPCFVAARQLLVKVYVSQGRAAEASQHRQFLKDLNISPPQPGSRYEERLLDTL